MSLSALVAGAIGGVIATLGALHLRPRLRKNSQNTTASISHPGPPHPDWRPGQRQPRPDYIGQDDNYLELDPNELGNAGYPLVISAIVPRPIAFACTLDKDGKRNLAPYSYFNIMSHNPPMVVIGPNRTPQRQGGMKDTEANILESGEFTLNMISSWFLEAANYTCTPFEHGIDEMEFVGLTPLQSKRVKPPRVKEAAVQMECKLRHTFEVKSNIDGRVTANILIAEVILWHVHEGVATKTPHSGHITVDLEKYQPVARLGGISYARVREEIPLPRLEQGQALEEKRRAQQGAQPSNGPPEVQPKEWERLR